MPFTDEELSYLMKHMAENDKRRYQSLNRISKIEIKEYLSKLTTDWSSIAGEELAKFTMPKEITGEKSRRLIVIAQENYLPPWGAWDSTQKNPSAFRDFRARVNQALAPHFVDHIDFMIIE